MTLPRAARYPAAYIQALIDVASNHGIHQETLLEHAGLDVADLRRPDVSIEQPPTYDAVSGRHTVIRK